MVYRVVDIRLLEAGYALRAHNLKLCSLQETRGTSSTDEEVQRTNSAKRYRGQNSVLVTWLSYNYGLSITLNTKNPAGSSTSPYNTSTPFPLLLTQFTSIGEFLTAKPNQYSSPHFKLLTPGWPHLSHSSPRGGMNGE